LVRPEAASVSNQVLELALTAGGRDVGRHDADGQVTGEADDDYHAEPTPSSSRAWEPVKSPVSTPPDGIGYPRSAAGTVREGTMSLPLGRRCILPGTSSPPPWPSTAGCSRPRLRA